MAEFIEDQAGIMLDSGDVGGDIQATKAVSRRFIKTLDDGTFAVITVTAYGTDEKRGEEGAGDREWLDVQQQIEWVRCRDLDDVGGSEIDRDYTYDYPFHLSPADLEVAYDWATSLVTSFDPAHLDWDGVTTIIH